MEKNVRPPPLFVITSFSPYMALQTMGKGGVVKKGERIVGRFPPSPLSFFLFPSPVLFFADPCSDEAAEGEAIDNRWFFPPFPFFSFFRATFFYFFDDVARDENWRELRRFGDTEDRLPSLLLFSPF